MVVRRPNNLFNPYTVIRDKELGDNGQLLDKSDWFVSDYINVSELSIVVISGKSQGQTNAFFNANKQFISQTLLAEGTVSVPSGAVYLRINAPITLLDTTAVTSSTPHTSQVTDLYVKQQITKRVRAVVSRPAGSTENKINYFNCGPTIKNIDNYDPNASYPNGIEYDLFTDSIDGIGLNMVKPLLSSNDPFMFQTPSPSNCWGYCIPTKLIVPKDIFAAYVSIWYFASLEDAHALRVTIQNTAPGYTDGYVYRIDWCEDITDDNHINRDNFGTTIGSGSIYCGTYDTNSIAYVYIYKPTIQSGNYAWVDVIIARSENGTIKYYGDPRNGHTKISLTQYPQIDELFNSTTYISTVGGKSYPRISFICSYADNNVARCWTPTIYATGSPITVANTVDMRDKETYSFTPTGLNPIVTSIEVYDKSYNRLYNMLVGWTYYPDLNEIAIYIEDPSYVSGSSATTVHYFISYRCTAYDPPTRNPHSKSITVSISGGRGSAAFTPVGSYIEIESATAPGTFGVNVSATYNNTTKQIRVDVTNAAGSSSVDCVVKYTSI